MNQKEIEISLYKSVVEISDKLNVYTTLFMDNKSLEILNNYNYGVISIFKNSLGHDIARLIYRLLDPKETKMRNKTSRDNFTFDYYKESFQVTKEIEKRICVLLELKKKTSLYRNRVLSHSDLNTKLGLEEAPLLRWKEVNYIIDLMKEILADIFRNNYDQELEFLSISVNPELFLNTLSNKVKNEQ